MGFSPPTPSLPSLSALVDPSVGAALLVVSCNKAIDFVVYIDTHYDDVYDASVDLESKMIDRSIDRRCKLEDTRPDEHGAVQM
jgi:hypothetical protein